MANLAAAFDILTRGADKSASDMDRVGNSSERSGHKVEKLGGSMRLMASTFTGASNQALGPLQEIADKFDIIERAGSSATTKIGGKLLGLGAAGLGAGSFLSTLASREKEGEGQLRASIEAVGGSYETFEDRINAVVKAGEHFGNQNATTLDALNRLTLTTHSPSEALKDLATAQDVAAAKHVPLQKAAEIVGLVFNGSTRAGKQFGLQLENTAGAAAGLVKAQNAVKTSNDRVTSAQESYNDKLAVYQQTLKPSLAQQQALFRAHENVTAAQHDAADAATRLKDAQKKAGDAADAGSRNVQKLADITRGQGQAAADSFAGHLRALGAQVEGTAAKIGEKYGSAINTISLGTIAVGTLIETGLLPKFGALLGRIGLTGKAFGTLRDVEVASSVEGAAAVEAASVTEVAALDGAAVASVEAGATMGGAFAALLPEIALVTTALFGLKDAFDAIKNRKSEGAAFKSAFDEIGQDLRDGLITADQAKKLTKQALLHPKQPLDLPDRPTYDPNTPDDYDQKSGRGRAAVNASIAASLPKVPKALSYEQQFKDFLKAMGLGTPANSITQAAAAEAAKAAKQAAVDAATVLRDSLKSQFDSAKSVLHDVLAQAKELRTSIADSLLDGARITDVFGTGPNLNANHAFGSGQDFASVKRFFEDRLTKLRRFAAELSALVHKGLDPATVAQIAQAGLDSGGRLADALSGASKSQLGELNSLTGQIGTVADSAGKRVTDVQFRAQIAADKKNTDILGKKLDEANRHLRVISREKPPTAVDQRAAAFLAGA